jgi:hypothetical protein
MNHECNLCLKNYEVAGIFYFTVYQLINIILIHVLFLAGKVLIVAENDCNSVRSLLTTLLFLRSINS